MADGENITTEVPGLVSRADLTPERVEALKDEAQAGIIALLRLALVQGHRANNLSIAMMYLASPMQAFGERFMDGHPLQGSFALAGKQAAALCAGWGFSLGFPEPDGEAEVAPADAADTIAN